MASQIIRIIKLSQGEVAFYDELSRIHLTISRPQANIYDYMNTSALKRAVANKKIVLVAGTLVAASKTAIEQPSAMSPAARKALNHISQAQEEIIAPVALAMECNEQEVIAEEPIVEAVESVAEVAEEVVEEKVVEEVTIEEVTPKKSTRKKKSKAAAEAKA